MPNNSESDSFWCAEIGGLRLVVFGTPSGWAPFVQSGKCELYPAYTLTLTD